MSVCLQCACVAPLSGDHAGLQGGAIPDADGVDHVGGLRRGHDPDREVVVALLHLLSKTGIGHLVVALRRSGVRRAEVEAEVAGRDVLHRAALLMAADADVAAVGPAGGVEPLLARGERVERDGHGRYLLRLDWLWSGSVTSRLGSAI